ncbi:hypothetical protein [Pseudomonas sp. Teo4]|uniref:hypothetical protein n=1 Tax=Pseudomonas sp. Teo4 TaxID=3064528 RepID=UPI002ABB524D|nr:hypothetical protein [Pseudomonas sp. Teo4]MDZ3991772.1 hypothetical protein [Pseudomonas sp. Teo4]
MAKSDDSGYIDPTYGISGQATVPAQDKENTDRYSLQVQAYATASDGSMVFFGHNPDDVYEEDGFLTRIYSSGQWDGVTKHVPVRKLIPKKQWAYYTMTLGEVDGEQRFFTASPFYYAEDGSFARHIAIQSYGMDLQKIVEFGNDGVALPSPPLALPHATGKLAEAHKISKSAQHKEAKPDQLFDYRFQQKLACTNEKITVLFYGSTVVNGVEDESIWCAVLNAKDGKPGTGLGADGIQSQVRLPKFDGKLLSPYRVAFLEDGGFFVLGVTFGEDKCYLQRFKPNATLDEKFANDVGHIEIPGSPLHVGLAAHKNRVVVSTAAFHNTSEATKLWGFDFSGKELPAFTKSIPFNPQAAPGLPKWLSNVVREKQKRNKGMTLNHLRFDAKGRLVLGGETTYAEGDSYLQLVRLEYDGELDVNFGVGGYSAVTPEDYLFNAKGMDLQGDGILVFSQITVDPGEGYQKVARFKS